MKRQKIQRDVLEKDKAKEWIYTLSTTALLHHILKNILKERFGRINKSVTRSIRQLTYRNWRLVVVLLVV